MQAWNGPAEARSTEGKGAGLFVKSGVETLPEGAVFLEERAVATSRDLPLPSIEAYCAHCASDVDPSSTNASQCTDCACCFCSPFCAEAASSSWHHKQNLGLCSPDLTALLHQLSAQLRQAYLNALFSAAQGGEKEEAEEEEEEAMGTEQLIVVQQVFTDCILALKVVSTLERLGAKEGLKTWMSGLSESQKEKGGAIVENFVDNVGESVVGLDAGVFAVAYDVCVTNSWPGVKARHLFAAHSLINHSCKPNALCTMHPNGTVHIATTSPVQSNTELCIDYTDGSPPASLSKEDRETLEAQWGHPCLCPVCVK